MSARSARRAYNGPEGFTVHDVRDPRKPQKVAEVKSPPGVHSHKLRVVDGDILYVNSERLGGDAGRNARTGLFIFDISKGGEPKQIGFYDTARHRPAPLRRRQQAQARVPAEQRAGLEQPRDLDARHQGPDQARGPQPVGPALDEGDEGDGDEVGAAAPHEEAVHPARPADDPRQPHVLRVVGRRHLGDRLLGPAQHEARRPPVLGAAVPRLQPHLLAARRPAVSDLHRRGARQAEILGRAVHVGDRRAQGGQAHADRDLHAGPREIF